MGEKDRPEAEGPLDSLLEEVAREVLMKEGLLQAPQASLVRPWAKEGGFVNLHPVLLERIVDATPILEEIMRRGLSLEDLLAEEDLD
jgi:cell division inhibitor SulA